MKGCPNIEESTKQNTWISMTKMEVTISASLIQYFPVRERERERRREGEIDREGEREGEKQD